MSLPKIDQPIQMIEIPSLKKNAKFRPFLVKEEKLLLMAKESNNSFDILAAIKQIINNCCLENLNIDSLTVFDLEYVFIKLRAFSVDNNIKVSYKDVEDEKIYNFDVNLDDVKIEYPKENKNVIELTNNSGIVMRYPSASLYSDQEFLNMNRDQFFGLITRCVDKIFVGEEIYEAKDYKISEIEEFLENLNVKVFEKINEFLLNVPKIQYEIKYKNSLGNERKIVLNSLNDFFIWR